MTRTLLEPLAFFVTPFLVYAAYLVVRRRYPFAVAAWSRMTISILVLLGLAAAVVGVFGFGLFASRHMGPYVPAHVENGRLVPGRFQ